MDIENIDNLSNKAAALDAELDAESMDGVQASTAVALQDAPPLREEIAGLLDTLAMAGSFMIPTFATHYNHDANLKIADALIKVAERYGWDLRASMLSENSVLLLWVGVAYTIGMPAGAVYADFKRMREKEVKEVQEVTRQQADAPAADGMPNAVVTGVN